MGAATALGATIRATLPPMSGRVVRPRGKPRRDAGPLLKEKPLTWPAFIPAASAPRQRSSEWFCHRPAHPAFDLAVQSFERVRAVELDPMGGREAHVGQHVDLGRVHQGSELGNLGPELIGHPSPLLTGRLGVVLGKRGGDEGRDDTTARATGLGEHVPHEVDAAPLPGRAHHLGHRGLDALVRVRDYQFYTTQAPTRQLPEDRRPERLGLRRADVHTEDFTPTATITTTETMRPSWRTFT